MTQEEEKQEEEKKETQDTEESTIQTLAKLPTTRTPTKLFRSRVLTHWPYKLVHQA